jgi:hypothetical protein
MSTLKGTKTHQNLMAAFAGESQANRRYLYFAKAADIEGYPEIAGLFRDTAEGETGHAHGHLDYLRKAGDPATGMPFTEVGEMLASAVAGLSAATIHYHGLGPILSNSIPWPAFAPVQSWFLASWLYVGYNLVLSISVLGPLGAEVNDKRVLTYGGLLGGLVLGLLAAGIKLAVSAHMPDIGQVEVPMLYLARLHPRPVQWFYTLILWAEIYTTAIACAYGFAGRVTEVVRGSYRGVVVLITAMALFGSGLGFSALLGFLYPLFGFVTLGVLAALAYHALRRPQF